MKGIIGLSFGQESSAIIRLLSTWRFILSYFIASIRRGVLALWGIMAKGARGRSQLAMDAHAFAIFGDAARLAFATGIAGAIAALFALSRVALEVLGRDDFHVVLGITGGQSCSAGDKSCQMRN